MCKVTDIFPSTNAPQPPHRPIPGTHHRYRKYVYMALVASVVIAATPWLLVLLDAYDILYVRPAWESIATADSLIISATLGVLILFAFPIVATWTSTVRLGTKMQIFVVLSMIAILAAFNCFTLLSDIFEPEVIIEWVVPAVPE